MLQILVLLTNSLLFIFQLNALNESSSQLHMQHQQQLCEVNEKQNALENNQNLLTCQLQEAQQQAEAYKVILCVLCEFVQLSGNS